MTIAQLAKVELHLHLEGASPPEFIRQLAHKKVDISGIFAPDGSYVFVILSSFWRSMRRRSRCCKVLKIFIG